MPAARTIGSGAARKMSLLETGRCALVFHRLGVVERWRVIEVETARCSNPEPRGAGAAVPKLADQLRPRTRRLS